MSNIKTLTKFTKVSKAVLEFKEKNKKIFDEYNSLILKQNDAEIELKADVKDNIKATISNEFIKVTYTPAYRKWYDPSIIIGGVTPKVKKEMIEAGAIIIKTDIDKVKIEKFIENGKLPVEVKLAAFHEKEQTPRISIKENKDD